MRKKDPIKIINEEILNFDYLGNDKYLKEEEDINVLKTEDFQKQFICDALLKKNNFTIDASDARIGSNWVEDFENADALSIEYFLKVEYGYNLNEKPIKFDLNFYADEVGRGFDWLDISVDLYTPDGNEIDFIAFKKAPPKIQTLFIREFCQDFIKKKTNIPINTPEMKDNI